MLNPQRFPVGLCGTHFFMMHYFLYSHHCFVGQGFVFKHCGGKISSLITRQYNMSQNGTNADEAGIKVRKSLTEGQLFKSSIRRLRKQEPYKGNFKCKPAAVGN
jgi:uncharacterized protein YktB (UPF0637 family)